MIVTKLKGQITRDRRLVVQVPREMTPGAVEIILTRVSAIKPTKRRGRRATTHPAFGIWAKRNDIADAATFAAHLRRRLETRADANSRN